MSRSLAALSLCLAAFASSATAQQPEVEIKRTNLARGLYMLRGVGGNIGVVTGKDGVFLVDDQMAELTPQIMLEIKRLSTQPVKFVLNTHWHQDHTGGNQNMAATGSIIVAHENVRTRLSREQFLELFNRRVPASPVEALPVVTFTDSMTFHVNDEEIHVFHVPAAHTDGDSIVHFRTANVVHTGDVFFNGIYPFIDTASGGSVEGTLAAVDRVLELANDETKIVPGHGELADRAALVAYRDMLANIGERVAELIAAGKSLNEIKAAAPAADYDKTWGHGFINPEQFVEIVFMSLSQ